MWNAQTQANNVALCSLVVAGLVLGACSTSPNARRLAEVTSQNTTTLSGQLSRLETASGRVAAKRAEIVVQLEVAAEESRRHVAIDGGALAVSSDPQAILWKKLQEYIATVSPHRKSTRLYPEGRLQELLAEREALTPPSDQLKAVATNLAKLAREPSTQERLSTLLGLLSTSIEAVEEAANNGMKASEKAEETTESQASVSSSAAESAAGLFGM